MDIDDYQERSAAVTRVEGDWISAFVGDEIPRIGAALEVRSPAGDIVYAVVRRHTGGREVDAMLLGRPDWVRPGCQVRPTGLDAHIPEPTAGVSRLDDLRIWPAGDGGEATFAYRQRTPDFAELDGARPPLRTGFDPLDRLTPLARAGFNLVLDASPKPAAFDGICRRVAAQGDFAARLWLSADARPADWATHQLCLRDGAPQQVTGLRVLSSWAGYLRDQGQHVLICAELPVLAARGFTSPEEAAMGVSIGQVIDHLGSALTSTRAATITAVIRLPLYASAAGIESIIETMDVGDVDAQLFIDEQGRFEPYRSSSNADLDPDARHTQHRMLSALSRAAAARDKFALMGEFGVDQSELDAIAEVEALRVSLG